MAKLVQRRCVVGFDRCERAGRRQIDEIERRNETRLVAAVPDVSICGRDERVNGRVPLGLGRKRRIDNGEALDLRDIEDRVFAQHGSLLDLIVFALEDERFGEHDMRAAFGLSHMRAMILRLLEGHPRVRRITVGVGTRPEDRNVDAAVRPAGDRVCRHDAADIVPFRFPGAHPRNRAALHLLDDGARDALINPHCFSPAQSKRTCAPSRAGERELGKGYHDARPPPIAGGVPSKKEGD